MLKKIIKKIKYLTNKNVNFIDHLELAKIVYNDKWIILDLRPKSEFKTSHIILSKNLNIIKFKDKINSLINKKSKVLLICHNGKQSHYVATYLKGRKYKRIFVLKNGYNNLILRDLKFIVQ